MGLYLNLSYCITFFARFAQFFIFFLVPIGNDFISPCDEKTKSGFASSAESAQIREVTWRPLRVRERALTTAASRSRLITK